MAVFISHSSKDDRLARAIYDRLTKVHGIKCYLDDLDPALQGTKNVTDVILQRLEECSYLMAVVTTNTNTSWWVPFEIGVARRAPRYITTFTDLSFTLPAYLKEWPVLKCDSDLDKFARWRASEARIGHERLIEAANEKMESQLTVVDLFHYGLHKDLGQL
jgi:hypothetical protein